MSDKQPVRRRSQAKRANSEAVQNEYQPYVDAEWGFVNHWYPALFSNELGEGDVEGIQNCGHPNCFEACEWKSVRLERPVHSSRCQAVSKTNVF